MAKQKNMIKYCLFAALAITSFSCNPVIEIEETTAVAVTAMTDDVPVNSAQAVSADRNKITGNWVRTDAPYNLNITDVLSDGNLKAEYLNPKSINVSKANWTADVNGAINIFIELRDANYPGSNYTLFYYPDKDLLAGKYFQAVAGETYDVGFIRVK